MIFPNFTPFPILTTDRLILRKISLDDAPEVFFLRSDAIVNQFIKREPALNLADAENWILKVLGFEDRNESINWAITLKGEIKIIGQICLWNIEKEKDVAEVGYSMHPNYFGKGLMTEALIAVNNYGFTSMNLSRIDAFTQKRNERSISMLEKNGFKRNFEFENIYPDKAELEYNTIYSRNK